MSATVNDSDESYAEGTPLVELFGDGARARLLSVFATKPDREFSKSELGRQAGITRKSVYEYIEELEELGAIKSVGEANTRRYTAADTEVATKLYELSGVTLQRLLEIEE